MGGNVPLGFDPDGRTLNINSAEATTIRTLYDLFEQHGTVREVNAFRFSLSMIKSKKSAAFRDQRAELP